MEFALFYEIPVARPWTPGKEHKPFKDVIEQCVFGEQMGWHSMWTVEHEDTMRSIELIGKHVIPSFA